MAGRSPVAKRRGVSSSAGSAALAPCTGSGVLHFSSPRSAAPRYSLFGSSRSTSSAQLPHPPGETARASLNVRVQGRCAALSRSVPWNEVLDHGLGTNRTKFYSASNCSIRNWISHLSFDLSPARYALRISTSSGTRPIGTT